MMGLLYIRYYGVNNGVSRYQSNEGTSTSFHGASASLRTLQLQSPYPSCPPLRSHDLHVCLRWAEPPHTLERPHSGVQLSNPVYRRYRSTTNNHMHAQRWTHIRLHIYLDACVDSLVNSGFAWVFVNLILLSLLWITKGSAFSMWKGHRLEFDIKGAFNLHDNKVTPSFTTECVSVPSHKWRHRQWLENYIFIDRLRWRKSITGNLPTPSTSRPRYLCVLATNNHPMHAAFETSTSTNWCDEVLLVIFDFVNRYT